MLTPSNTSVVSVDIYTNAGCNYSTNLSVSPFSGSGNTPAYAGADQNIQLSYASLSVTTSLMGSPPPPNTNVVWEVLSNNGQYVNIATPFAPLTSVTFLDTGNYLFIYRIVYNGCISEDTMSVTVSDCRVQVRLSAEVITTPATCEKYTNDGKASVIVTKGDGPFSYSWSNGAQTKSIEAMGTGRYWVKVTDQSQCFVGELPFYGEFEIGYVNPSPIADFTSDPSNQSYIYLGNANFSFTNTSQFATHYVWNFGKNDTSTAIHPYITLLDTGILWVKLSAFNEECKGVVIKRYEIVPNGTIYIANAFSPNGDTRNDVFAPIGEDIISLYFAIYDRTGKKIFESRSTESAWDGKINGQDAPEGVYTFWLEATMKGNRSIRRPGTVTLIR